MTDLSERLERLGLSQYLDTFVSEGFDTWDTLLDITESDLNYLRVKLGHRRKLQRAIAESRGQPRDRALSAETSKASMVDDVVQSDESGTEVKEARDTNETQEEEATASTAARTPANTPGTVAGAGTKRKYRRHPKQDPDAPERPASAYVIFSNQVRDELKDQNFTFTEIAKFVGERWQILPQHIRENCEREANAAKEKYYAELAEYKKTPEYAQYQIYLADFKAKHKPPKTEGKRSRFEHETSSSTVGNNGEGSDKHRLIAPAPQGVEGYYRPQSNASSPRSATMRHATSGPQQPSASPSPAVHSEALNSPPAGQQLFPEIGSPTSSSAYITKELRPRAGPAESRPPAPAASLQHSSSSQSGPSGSPSLYRNMQGDAWKESLPYQPGHFRAPPRRTSHASPPLPPLVHQESTMSSDSVGIPYLPPALQAPLLPIPGGSKSDRTLPQPVPTPGLMMSPGGSKQAPGLVHASLPPIQYQGHGTDSSLPSIRQQGLDADSSRASNWPALLRASEIARETDMDIDDPMGQHPPS